MFKEINATLRKKRNSIQGMGVSLKIEDSLRKFILSRFKDITPEDISTEYNNLQGLLTVSSKSKIIAQELALIRIEAENYLKRRYPNLIKILVR